VPGVHVLSGVEIDHVALGPSLPQRRACPISLLSFGIHRTRPKRLSGGLCRGTASGGVSRRLRGGGPVGMAGFEPTTSSGTVSCPLTPWGALVQARATLLTSWSVSAC
jgi:hypothetical protein